MRKWAGPQTHLPVDVSGGEIAQSLPGGSGAVLLIEPHLDVVCTHTDTDVQRHTRDPHIHTRRLTSHLSAPCHRAGRPPLLRSHSQQCGPSSRSSGWRRWGPLRDGGQPRHTAGQSRLQGAPLGHRTTTDVRRTETVSTPQPMASLMPNYGAHLYRSIYLYISIYVDIDRNVHINV